MGDENSAQVPAQLGNEAALLPYRVTRKDGTRDENGATESSSHPFRVLSIRRLLSTAFCASDTSGITLRAHEVRAMFRSVQQRLLWFAFGLGLLCDVPFDKGSEKLNNRALDSVRR